MDAYWIMINVFIGNYFTDESIEEYAVRRQGLFEAARSLGGQPRRMFISLVSPFFVFLLLAP